MRKGEARDAKRNRSQNNKKSGEAIKSYEYKTRHRTETRHFSRNTGELGFVNTIMLIMNFFKRTSNVEIYKFFREILNKMKAVSRQAFEQSRSKISYTAFKELYEISVETAEEAEDLEKYAGYRLLAWDGTTLLLPESAELGEYFGGSTPSEGKIYARGSMTVDMLNRYIVSASISPYSTGERKLALEHLSDLARTGLKKSIILADRGYWSPELVAAICESEQKFLFRIQKNTSKIVRGSAANSGTFKTKYNGKTYKLRYFKFTLPSGEIEYLATNLAADDIFDDELAELYCMRWGIESKYNELKSFLQIENFSGKSVMTVKQDFFATVYLSNIIAFLTFEADEIIKSERADSGNKLDYQLNINVAAGIFKDRLIKIILHSDSLFQRDSLRALVADVSRFVSAVRPGRRNSRDPNYRKPHHSFNRKNSL